MYDICYYLYSKLFNKYRGEMLFLLKYPALKKQTTYKDKTL